MRFRRLANMTGRMQLDLGTFLLQWAAGGMLFGWVTTRGRLVSLGYGWLLRAVYGLMAIGAVIVWLRGDLDGTRIASVLGAVVTALLASWGIILSVLRRKVGVSGRHELDAMRQERVASMPGVQGVPRSRQNKSDLETETVPREFPPGFDLAAAMAGFATLLIATPISGGSYWVSAIRLVLGAALLGSVSDAMLLGHWYLTQPGLPRTPLQELVKFTAIMTPLAAATWIIPTGIVQVFTGEINDGFSGLLGWVWVVCVVSTIGLVGATWLALKERSYSAVMAATGLLYLAILTAFGVDLVSRAVIAP